MTWCFRARFTLGDLAALECPDEEWLLTKLGEVPAVLVKPVTPLDRDPSLPPLAIADARSFVLRGSGYPTSDEAITDGLLWRSRLMLVFAHNQVGADFGHRTVISGLLHGDLEQFAATGARVLPDLLELIAFECEPQPVFVGREPGRAVGSRGHQHLVVAMNDARMAGLNLTPELESTYALYAASFSQPSNDARFALLMIAVETMIDIQPRSDAAQAHVDGLIAATRASGLPQADVDSMVGALSWLKGESISKAGRRLAVLAGRSYMGGTETPTTFFTRCYATRSNLFHGHHPIPSREEVDARAADLEVFVGDLISATAGLLPNALPLVTARRIPVDENGQPVAKLVADSALEPD